MTEFEDNKIPATVEIDEQNGTVGAPVLSHNITNTNMGNTDAINLDPVAFPVTPGNNTFEKWQKIHVTALGGSSKIDNFKVWRTGALGGAATHVTNANTTLPAAATYAQPVTTSSTVATIAMPTTTPATTNVAVAGAATGLTAVGSTDFIVHQIKTNAADVAGSTSTMNFQYDEVA